MAAACRGHFPFAVCVITAETIALPPAAKVFSVCGDRVSMSSVQALLYCIFPALVIAAALRDLTSFTIPNWIPAALAIAFLPATLASGLGWEWFGLHLAVGLAGFVAGVTMFALGWIGGGDAKLFAAAALWLGWPAIAPFILVTAVAGGGLAVGLLAMRSSLVRAYTPSGAPAWTQRLMEQGGPATYGAAIAAGALFAFPDSSLIASWS
jgi:prepilin peptidase CpaA